MKIHLLAPFLAVTLLFSACSSSFNTVEYTDTTTDTTTDTPVTTTSTVSGAQVDYAITYDTSKWIMTPGASSGDAEYEFEHMDGDVYALVIAERIEIDASALREIALSNAQSVAPDATVTFEEDRTVNGAPMKVMKIDGTIYGIAFEYYGYYYVGSAGTIQFITYTSSNLISAYEADLTELLNGLTVTE